MTMIRIFIPAYRRSMTAFLPTQRSVMGAAVLPAAAGSSAASSRSFHIGDNYCNMRGSGGGYPSSKPSSVRRIFAAGKWWFFGSASGTILSFFQKIPVDAEEMVDVMEDCVEVVEDAIETVEKVATVVDKVSDVLEENLPDGKFKVAVEAIGDAAENIVDKTNMAQEILHKVDEAREEIKELFDTEDEKKDLPEK